MQRTYAIRRANANLIDATLLRDVEHDSLGDSDYTPDEMLAVLRRPEQIVYLACDGGSMERMPNIVGFCACLVTYVDAAGPCLEIDMLGVRAAHRGRGIARQLIQRAMQDAGGKQIRTMRAVIAEDNLASQRAFERAGFRRSQPIRRMLVHELKDSITLTLPHGWRWQVRERVEAPQQNRDGAVEALQAETHAISDTKGRRVAHSQCLAVFTLAYSGLWVESLRGATNQGNELLAQALALRARRLGLDEVGCLAPTDDEHLQQTLVNQGYQDVGRYWVYVAGCPATHIG